jgi:acetylornithine deacetylase/succinyl-diaminopimelate desuccinylase-like protein
MSFYSRLKILFLNGRKGPERVPCFSKWRRAGEGSVPAFSGEAPRFEMCPGLLETRFYAAQGIPAYAYGPGLLSVAHGPNEYVDLRKVIDTAAIYALTAEDALKP